MKVLPPEMLEAMQLTRAGRLSEATELIQKLLTGHPAAPVSDKSPALMPPTLDLVADDMSIEPTETLKPHSTSTKARNARTDTRGKTVYDHLTTLRPLRPARQWQPSDLSPPDGKFLRQSFRNAAGERNYKLYIPSGADAAARPLIIMLHGCTQSADDFAAGTRMNFAAEDHSCFVAYPEQTQTANPSRCWNWFDKNHQQRGYGEPSILAGLVDQICREQHIDRHRVYIAGLSAGGAAAAAMADMYPDVFAAVGVHSGLPCGSAQDLPSAFAAMKGGQTTERMPQTSLPTIVFHGDRDTTVHPANGAAIAHGAASAGSYDRATEQGQVENGRRYSRIVHRDPCGKSIVEEWIIHGAGHAWAGGHANGSYTDASGPDATGALLRFFLEHRRPD